MGSSLDGYVAALQPEKRQIGAVFAVGSRIVGLDLFDSADTFRKLMGKLVRSYSLDAMTEPKADAVAPVEEAVRRFLDKVRASTVASFPAIGEGESLRLESDSMAGGALVVDGRMLHLCAFESPA